MAVPHTCKTGTSILMSLALNLIVLLVIKIVLLHKEGDRAILYFLKCMYLDSTAAGVFLFFHIAMNFNYEFNVRKIQSILEFILHLNIDERKNGLF